MVLRGGLFGLGAAVLFGASAPIAKRLLPGASPVALASLLYLGAGVALSLYRAIVRTRGPSAEAGLQRADMVPLLGITLCGGVLGPWLMLVGLSRLPGVTGALLLNLEAPFTILIALIGFHEHLTRREAVAASVIVLGAIVLGARPGDVHTDIAGVLALSSACLAWGLDNNLSQRLSVRDPLAVVQVKTLGAGTGMLLLALLWGVPGLSDPTTIAAGATLGAVSYGLSLILDMHALRLLGAAREAAFFAAAPFAGAILAVPLLGERPRMLDLTAAALMATGVGLMLRARHGHLHTHEEVEHEHQHVHDEHHRHEHPPGFAPEPHSHAHRHLRLTHDHPHVSDLHHRHGHRHSGGGEKRG